MSFTSKPFFTPALPVLVVVSLVAVAVATEGEGWSRVELYLSPTFVVAAVIGTPSDAMV